MSDLIEKGIRPLVSALNTLGFTQTVYSCEGHFDEEPREKFLPTAYVTFGIRDPGEFGRLYERIRAFNEMTRAVSLRLTYDCILGRYTLSVWADPSLQEPSEKRAAVDSACIELSQSFLDCTDDPPANADSEPALRNNDVFPCGKSSPPCMLVIPSKPLICPFAESSERGAENSQ